MLHTRNKIVKLADREDWIAASEFVEDDLVSDSDEEKRIKVQLSLRGPSEKNFTTEKVQTLRGTGKAPTPIKGIDCSIKKVRLLLTVTGEGLWITYYAIIAIVLAI